MTTQATWRVWIFGDEGALAHLAGSMSGADPAVIRATNGFQLQATAFKNLHDAHDVRSKAEEIVTTLSGIARLELGSANRLQVGSVQRINPDGMMDWFFSLGGSIRPTGNLSMKHIRQDGSVVYHRAGGRGAGWLTSALADPDAAKALRLRDGAAALDWSELYKIFEIIRESAGQESKMEARNWTNKAEIVRFRRTAQSPAVAGDGARHGVQKQAPPPDPMTPQEGRLFIDGLLASWLDCIRN
jgi:hypothetical protein